ncbi:MAG: sugar ABC transporter permease [Eubacteriales bacterium]|nr:sugar ABC transporter permease [Eubacteriales bacterium]
MKKRWFAAFILPGFAGVFCFVLLPFADVLRCSFMTAVTGEFVGIYNYRRVFENEAFRLAVKNTARFTAVCLPLLIFLGLLTALLLAGLKQAQTLKAIFLFPMAMPAATIVLVWKMVFSKGGFLNALMGRQIDFMGTDLSFWVLVFSYVWKNLGYTVVLWLAGILGVPSDIIEAAKADGAGKIRIFLSVLMPQLKGVFYTIAVLSVLNSFKVFREAYLVAGAYPQESMYLLQHLFNNWFVWLELDKMAAAAVCLAAALLILILLLTRLWEEGEAAG